MEYGILLNRINSAIGMTELTNLYKYIMQYELDRLKYGKLMTAYRKKRATFE